MNVWLTNNTNVRAATEADADRMVTYMSALTAEAPDTITRRPPPSSDDQRQFVRRAESAERAFILLAMQNDEVLGLLDLWAGGTPETRHSARFGMSVAKARRNRGVGRQLVGAAVERALAWDGFCRLELEVAAWNMPAIHLYERLDFKLEGRKCKAVNIRGLPEDTLVMARTW